MLHVGIVLERSGDARMTAPIRQLGRARPGSGYQAIATAAYHSLPLTPEPCTLFLLALGGLGLRRRLGK